MNAFDLVDRLRQYSPSAANLVMSTALPTIIPLTGGLGMKVEEVTDELARASLPLKRRTRNHVGSIYFGAQMTLAEITMGLLLFRLFPPGPYGMLVKRVEADFKSKGKGTIQAICQPPAEALEALRAVESSPERKAEAWIPVQVVSKSDGTVITEARFLAALKKF